MKLEVPFYVQSTPTDCAATTLKMIAEYFGIKKSSEELTQMAMSDKKGATMTLGIAKASGELGLKTEFYSKTLEFHDELFEKEFFKKFTDGADENRKKQIVMIEACKKNGVALVEKIFSLDEFLHLITENSIPIVLLDWNVIENGKYGGYNGHFVPVVGYDSKFIYVHQEGQYKPQAFMPIERQLFEKARKAEGTDEDLVIIHGKPAE